MRIIDEENKEIQSPNFDLGHLVPDRILIKHHDAIEAVEEKSHYEVIAEYPNGGKDVRRVIDIEGVTAQDAWDEYEDILRYVLYSEAELEEINKAKNMPSLTDRISAMEALMLSSLGVSQ